MVLLIKVKVCMDQKLNHILWHHKRDWIWDLHFHQMGIPKNGFIMMSTSLIAITPKLLQKASGVDNILVQALITTNQWIIQHWDSRVTSLPPERSANLIHSLVQVSPTKTNSFCQAFCKNNRNWNRDKNILKIRFSAINKMISSCLETNRLIDMLFQEND